MCAGGHVISATACITQPFSGNPGAAAERGLFHNCGTAPVPSCQDGSCEWNRRRQTENEHLAAGTTTTCRGDRMLRRTGPGCWPNRT